ncbi:benzoate-CoA ligase family protein [Chelatococcus sp. SYSU_G07232]|uniref:Benzoate-CoA ligase family protein n=1 Tax=Chelatococcus albus TaxID=3047466 RepID=A0ABT7ADP5_9HYPH|nr:benzoate-CoA ligase family protein [Chelatococcus sp. SYSU_G07232]MDJ1157501.1 benzoate-CoA ligase family protein [Chelatococcus sp. SYSU_G07232]
MAAYTAHVDTFARDHLPPRDEWPDFLFTRPELVYPERLNCVSELLDKWIAAGEGDRPAVGSPTERWSYAELADKVNRIANVLVRDFGLVPGNRVLLRAPNNPLLVACYLAVLKAGGVVVATMPLLRAKELGYMVRKAEIRLALCDHRLLDELVKTKEEIGILGTIVPVGSGRTDDLLALMRTASPHFTACPTAADDVCLIGFTSGTTGEPKGTMHFHRDMLAICDAYGRNVLSPNRDDVFTGSPPLAFTFGLGGLVLFPMRVGASSILLERAGPDELVDVFRRCRPTVCFTAPTAYRALLARLQPGDTATLRICVSAGEALPKATWEAWKEATGLPLLDGIGATEMLHIFISAPVEKIRPGATGLPVPGYEAKIVDDLGRDLPPGSVGRLAVRGPTGCRYLADERQRRYVQNGWNITGDTYLQDADGYFWYQARSDDMIVSAGYNIAGPEVEAALLTHPAVQECGVVGAPDEERGQIVKAYVVLKPGHAADAAMVKALQDHVKAEIAPYKYPRVVAFVDALPRTETGKLQRFVLRRIAAEGDGSPTALAS